LHVFFSQLVTMNAFWFINVKIPSSFTAVAVALMVVGLGGALPDAPEAAGAPLAQPIDKAQRVGLILGFNPQSPSLKAHTCHARKQKKVQASHLFV
jgi:hypothetical protein